MPQYTVESPSGKQVTLEGPTPPTEAELNQVFGQVGDSSSKPIHSYKYPTSETTKSKGSLLGVAEVPGGLARGVVQGGQEMLNTVANVNELLGSPVGQSPRKLVDASRKALDILIPPSKSIAGKVSEGLGQVPGMATTYGFLPESKVIPAAAVLGAINSPEHDTESMIKGAAANALIMGLLGQSQRVASKSALRGAAMGAATTGGAALLSGQSDKDVIAQAALGGGFSLYPQESQDRIKKDYALVKQFAQDPRANTKAMFDVLKEDPVQRTMRKVNLAEGQLREQALGINTQSADMQHQQIEQAESNTKEDLRAIENLKTAEQKRADAENAQIEQDRASTITRLQSQAQKFIDNMPETAYEKAKYVQNNYKQMFGQATEQYGKQLDRIATKIGKKGVISQDNAFGILGTALDRSINDYGSSDTPFARKMNKLMDKYNPESQGKASNPQLAELMSKLSPEKRAELQKSNPSLVPQSEPIKFKDFYTDVKGVINSMDPSEHNSSILRREIGNYIAKVDPSFKDLQGEYSQIASYREELAKVFHPYDGEASLKAGEKWLTQFGMGEAGNKTYTDERILNFLESGFKGKKINMSGLGDISSELKSVGTKLDTIKQEIASSKDPIYSKYAMQMADIAQQHARVMEDLANKKQDTVDNLKLEIDKIKDEISQTKAKALLDIEMKKRIYEKARVKAHKLDETRKRLEGLSSALGLGMAGAGLWKASRLFRASLVARRALRAKGTFR